MYLKVFQTDWFLHIVYSQIHCLLLNLLAGHIKILSIVSLEKLSQNFLVSSHDMEVPIPFPSFVTFQEECKKCKIQDATFFVGFQTFYLLIAIKNTDVVHPSRCADRHISVSAGGLPLKPNALSKTVFYVNQMQYFSGHVSFTNCGDPTKHNKLFHLYPITIQRP